MEPAAAGVELLLRLAEDDADPAPERRPSIHLALEAAA